MRREIQTQDAIMRGYQKENESATATIAAMRREFAVKEGDFTGTIDRLNGEIARLRLETERTGGDGARYLERQLAAEASLKTAQLEFGERERELVRERDAARAAARAAEAKMAGPAEWTRATSETTREEASRRRSWRISRGGTGLGWRSWRNGSRGSPRTRSSSRTGTPIFAGRRRG